MTVSQRPGRVFTPDLHRDYRRMVRGEGVYLYDEQGRRYLDGSAGLGVVSVGHGVRSVVDAMARQAETLAFCASNLFANAPAEALAARLATLTPPGLDSFVFTSGGSEANEAAFKVARQYMIARGTPERHLVVGREYSYHGATLGTLSATGMEGRRKPFTPLLLNFPHAMACYCYRCPIGDTYPRCGVACADDIERVIEEAGPDTVMAFIAEPIVGAAAGAVVPPREYFAIVREICDRYGILLIADEVICGFGRTGKMFGSQHFDVVPDLMSMGKGMAGGYAPIGAVAVHANVRDMFEETGTRFEHVFTFGQHPVSAAAANAVLDILVEQRLDRRAADLGEYLFRRAEALRESSLVGDIRGRGLLMGVELVRDRQTRTPFASALGVSQRLADAALERGLVIYPGSGSAGELRGDHFLFFPPLVVETQHLDFAIDALRGALDEVAVALA